MTWLLWAAFLLLQNYCFTWVSRARNGDDLREHVKAAFGSNGIWFLSQIVVISVVSDSIRGRHYFTLTLALLWYTLWTIVGSVTAHYLLIEKKRRAQVGYHSDTSVRGVIRGILRELFSAKSTAAKVSRLA